MLYRTSHDFRKFFLLQFTREIIKNTKTEAILELQERIKYQNKKVQEKIDTKEEKKKNIEEITNILRKPLEEIKRPLILSKQGTTQMPRIPMVLRIPEPRLPPHLSYLRPYATDVDIDLGPLNSFINDPSVSEIECQGEDTDIIIRGRMGQKTAGLIFSEDDINQIIDAISYTSKIPKEFGIFRAIIGRINFSAIISENGSRFLIKKLNSQRIY